MRWATMVVVGALVSAPIAVSWAAPGDVDASFAAPCRFPAGIATDGTNLFVADWREGRVFEVSPADGAVVRDLAGPTLHPHGLAYGNGRLFVADDHTGRIQVLNVDTGIVENGFDAPGPNAKGLAFADGKLFILESSSRHIYSVLPEDGTILKYFDVPDRSCTCMTYDGRYLWVANRVDDELYMVDPENGMVIGVLDAPGPYAAGLAWLDGHLWNADFQNDRLYRLVVHDEQMYRLSEPREAQVEYLWTLANYGPGTVRNLTVNLAHPDELVNQKLLSEVSYSPVPAEMVSDKWGQKCARIEIAELPAGKTTSVTAKVDVKVSAIRYLIIPEKTGTLEGIPIEIREAYTVDGSRYRIDSPYIQKKVKEIVGDEKNPYWIARKIYNYLIETLEYEMVGGWDVPEVVLQRGTGSCSEYTFSFIALCRAAGLPARYQGSIVVRGDDASIDEAFHRWAQVYLPNYGWVPVDANRGDSASPVQQCKGFGELANRFLITTQSGGDSEYLCWGYNAHATYQTTGFCNIDESNFGFWEPLGSESTSDSNSPAAANGQCGR